MMAAAEPEAAGIAPTPSLCSRAAVLKGLTGALLVVAAGGARAAVAAEASVEESMMVNYEAPSKVFSFDYPDSWALAPKPLQTHQEEVREGYKMPLGLSGGGGGGSCCRRLTPCLSTHVHR